MFLKFLRFPAGTALYVRPAAVLGYSLLNVDTQAFACTVHLEFGATAVWGSVEDIEAMMDVLYAPAAMYGGLPKAQDCYNLRVKRAQAEAEVALRQIQAKNTKEDEDHESDTQA